MPVEVTETEPETEPDVEDDQQVCSHLKNLALYSKLHSTAAVHCKDATNTVLDYAKSVLLSKHVTAAAHCQMLRKQCLTYSTASVFCLSCLSLHCWCLRQIAGRVIRSDDQILQQVEVTAEVQLVPQAPALCLPLNMVRSRSLSTVRYK
jgi:hypothetical protein